MDQVWFDREKREKRRQRFKSPWRNGPSMGGRVSLRRELSIRVGPTEWMGEKRGNEALWHNNRFQQKKNKKILCSVPLFAKMSRDRCRPERFERGETRRGRKTIGYFQYWTVEEDPFKPTGRDFFFVGPPFEMHSHFPDRMSSLVDCNNALLLFNSLPFKHPHKFCCCEFISTSPR